ncbi:neuron navigator 2-like isoform X8 [Mytilus edulis]|uniref:neuron navigator 2-like isoform X8 n=1 Tax=Mytilus edulis TaxID=6550 RepID=UPI0039EF0F41
MASSADSRQNTPTKIPLPKQEGSKITKKLCDTRAAGKTKEIGPRKVSSTTAKEVGGKQLSTISREIKKKQTSVSKEPKREQTAVSKEPKKEQTAVYKEPSGKRSSTVISNKPSVITNKVQTSVSKELRREVSGSRETKTSGSREIKKENTFVCKEGKKGETNATKDIKKDPICNSKETKTCVASAAKETQREKTCSKEQTNNLTTPGSPSLRREQTVIYRGPPIKTGDISIKTLTNETETNVVESSTNTTSENTCLQQNELNSPSVDIDTSCQNKINILNDTDLENTNPKICDVQIISNEPMESNTEPYVPNSKRFSQSRRESRKGKISDSSDSGVSLGGADVGQIDDFYDENDTIGVQAQKEVQEFSVVLKTCDDENDPSLISIVDSNAVETSVATITNLKDKVSGYDSDDILHERGSTFLGIYNYVPSNLKIYTDWANHYLEKARNKRFISDLQQDVSDGVLLADVIEAVTNEKIREIKSKPKNTAQMVENINTCLTFLANLGVSVEGLSAKDIKDGNLKAILGLFFSLSRYKQQQKTQQKQEHNKCHVGETTHQSSGSSKNQLSSSDSQSRLPSPFKSGNSKCPTITNPSTKPSSGSKSTSKSSADKHLNQQNNNQQSATLPAGSSLNTVKSSHPSSRATSPAVPGSGIPTPGGRSLTTPRPSGEKQPRVVSTGSTTSTSSTASNKSTSQKTTPQNKNSMLDKFKFFNSKDKSKGKSGVPKSTSKTSTGSTASTSSSSLALSSDRDSRISTDTRSSTASARSSSSTDPGAISFSPESESPKLPPKTKSLGKTVNKKEHPSTLPLAQNEKHYSSSDHGSGVKKSSSKTDLKSGQKGTKIGTLIPSKSASKSSKSTSSTPTSTGIRTPTSIPKPGKSRSKDEKSKSHSQSSSAATSPSVSGVPSTKHSGLSAYGSPSVGSHSKQHYETISDHSKASVQDSDKMLQMKGRYTEIDYSDGKIDRVGDGQYSKSSSKMSGYQSGIQKPSVNKEGNLQQTVNVVKPTCSVANTQMHAMTGISDLNTQSGIINRALPPPLPKTEPPPRSNTPSMKDHSNNSVPQTKKDGAKNESPGSPSGQSSISGHKSDSTSSSSSHSGPSGNNSNSSTESVIYRPSDSGSDVGSISATNSPRLGLKVLQPQQPINKSANNVAIVQPRHGEKVETTFDSEVRTKTVNKDKEKSSKETTFSEKDTTFVDDSGEAMDIKPMQPILRAMPYGTGYLRGYTTPPGKIFHNPGYATPTATYFASTSRLGMNRPLMDHGKFYSGPIRKTPSSGLNSSFDGDYSSDYESFDYISGYMSDGDILKGSQNKVDEMNCGYMSEGGASLYARRLQQRFREGMQAVKESMQKNNGMIDDDRQHHKKFQMKRRQSVPRSVRFDDSSSISSGEISDAVNEISTDDGNLTGGSSQSDTNPYHSLKRAPQKDVRQQGQFPVKRAPNLGTSAFMGSDYGGESGPISGWRKYSLPQTNRLLSSDPADYAYLYNNYEQLHSWRTNQANQLRKLSNVSQPEIHHYRRHSDDYANSETSNKRDSETNTDQSHLLESSMRRMQQGRPGSGGSIGQGIYGYRRPTSNTSTSSAGSGKGEEVSKSSTVGSRLARHTIDANGNRNENAHGIPRPGSAQALRCTTPVKTDMGPDGYGASTLERRKKGSMSSLKSSNSAQTDSEIYKSNTLGRTKKGFGNGIVKGPPQGENGNMCSSTIISNPHATYGKNFTNGSGNYVAMEYGSPRNSNHGIWLKSANGNVNAPMGHVPSHLSETESMDSISSHASSIQAQIQQARALSGASARILSRDSLPGNGMGLSRSNSVKSTHSDSAYASAQQYMSDHEASFSQIPSPQPPSSPTPSNSSSSRFTYPMTAYGSPSAFSSPGMPQNMVRSNTQTSLPPYGSLALSKINRDEDGSRLTKSATLDYSFSDYDYTSVHGSNLSLVSSASSHYSTAEEKQNAEVRKLRRELESAQEKVSTLTTQLSTNAHVVAAFEQSLSNMTHRLQHLTSTSNQKDSELNELRTTIESLKRQSGFNIPDPIISPNVGRRHTSPGMVAKVDIHSSPNHQPHQHHHHHQHHQGEARITRQMSSDSVSSINSLSSACSMTSQQSAATDGDAGKGKKKKKGWLRSSFSKAFAKKKNRNGSMSDCEMDMGSLRSNASAPNSPLLQVHMPNGPSFIKGSHSSGAIYEAEDVSTVLDLRKQLRDKDMKLTDTRLEALSSAHQLEQLRETMTKMKNEMSALKADNDRLQRMMVGSRGLNSSQSSLLVHSRTNSDSLERSISVQEQPSLEMLLSESQDREGKRVTMTVYLGSKPSPLRLGTDVLKPAEVLIGSLSVSGKTKWDILDNIVRKILKEYVLRVDPVTNLGLSAESVYSYHISEIMRTKEAELPELLPIGYLVGETMQIGICLKGTKQNSVDSLAFETLIPKSIVQRYVSLLLEHRRIILCGPSGTGKTYLAQKLAEHLVLRSGKELTAGSVATFNVDHKSAKELRQYLANIADQCENSSAGELPSVIILDNLHHVGSLGEVFNGFLSVKYQKCPYIIGTMNQATCSTTNLQLHHNFRWVLCANHMEPVKGFLGRFLRRKLVEAEVRTGIRNNDLNKIIDWIPKVWLHINKFLETHSSSDVTIGPRLFLTCPMDITASQIWFIDLWNYSIIPYMLEAVREGLQVYGRRAPWEDPTDWIMETYPWTVSKEEDSQLLRIRQEDVGYDTPGIITSTPQPKAKSAEATTENGDQLLNMIKRLQEAANYSSQSQDDDSASIDSHSSSIQEISISSMDSTSCDM